MYMSFCVIFCECHCVGATTSSWYLRPSSAPTVPFLPYSTISYCTKHTVEYHTYTYHFLGRVLMYQSIVADVYTWVNWAISLTDNIILFRLYRNAVSYATIVADGYGYDPPQLATSSGRSCIEAASRMETTSPDHSSHVQRARVSPQ